MIKSKFSIFLATLLIVGFSFVVLTESVKAGTAMFPCTLVIEKDAIPADNTPFDFVATGDINDTVTLSDPGNPIFMGGMEIDQTITLTEELPTGWELQSIECTEGRINCGNEEFEPCLSITIDEESNSITATCLDNDEASCTFTNTKIPNQVPTLSEWGLMALAGLLAVIGFVVIRRKQLLTNR